MDCTLDQHLLEGYLDGELGFEGTLEVEAHLASCRGCASEVQSWKDVRGVLQRSDLYHNAPASLEEKIRTLAPRQNRSERFPWFQRWIWAGGSSCICDGRAADYLSDIASRGSFGGAGSRNQPRSLADAKSPNGCYLDRPAHGVALVRWKA
jgi:anti-sigma factor RsiW